MNLDDCTSMVRYFGIYIISSLWDSQQRLQLGLHFHPLSHKISKKSTVFVKVLSWFQPFIWKFIKWTGSCAEKITIIFGVPLVRFINYGRNFKLFLWKILTGKLNVTVLVMFQMDRDFNNSIRLEVYISSRATKSPKLNLLLRKL